MRSHQTIKKNLNIFKDKEKEINKYLSKRFKGDSQQGFKSIAFRETTESKSNYKNKKFFTYILLQMQIIIHGNIIKFFFLTYTGLIFTLKELSKVNFKNWYIKLHPAGKMSSENKVNKNSQIYGNKQIIEFFKKYNVPESIVKKCPSNLEILTKKNTYIYKFKHNCFRNSMLWLQIFFLWPKIRS